MSTHCHPALGIDYGTVRIGVAATDPMGIIAYPVETIFVEKTDPVQRIVRIVQERHISTLVMGIPVRLDGTEGSAADKVRTFARLLSAACPGVPMIFVDEFLSTATAQEKLHTAGKKAKQFRKIVDQAAAVEILNIWMDSVLG